MGGIIKLKPFHAPFSRIIVLLVAYLHYLHYHRYP